MATFFAQKLRKVRHILRPPRLSTPVALPTVLPEESFRLATSPLINLVTSRLLNARLIGTLGPLPLVTTR